MKITIVLWLIRGAITILIVDGVTGTKIERTNEDNKSKSKKQTLTIYKVRQNF